MLEWVEDTMPFGSFLTDKGAGKAGAHRRYFPNDWCVRPASVPISLTEPAGWWEGGKFSDSSSLYLPDASRPLSVMKGRSVCSCLYGDII